MRRLATTWMLSLGCAVALPVTAADIDYETVIKRAQALANAPYQSHEGELPQALEALDYDGYRQIRFKPERAYWQDASPFSLQLFHSGSIYTSPVAINVIDNGISTPLPFTTDNFSYEGEAASLKEQDLSGSGYAGFRLHYPLNQADYADEFAVFLGASYFRLVGQEQHYGLSTRGLAIDTAEPEGEEFPAFREFWLYKPAPEDDSLTLLALLDSPSLSGAYRITLTPGEQTDAEVEAALFARRDIAKLGIAPLTSMYAFGENTPKRPDDFRPQVHDSDGLLIHNGADEWLWRPLTNPHSVTVSAFQDQTPNGFGLMQRERRFEHYLDREASYHRRPSQWVEPLDEWGEGHVELVELPTPDETQDNIVAYWVAAEPLKAGDSRRVHYRTFTRDDTPTADTLAHVIRTRQGSAAGPGQADDAAHLRQFVVDFAGDALADLAPDAAVALDITSLQGDIVAPQVSALPDGAWRASFRLDEGAIHDIRLRLTLDDQPISETWTYLWTPDA